jgi:hypothetical protein
VEQPAAAGVRPWREAVAPHPEVADGRCLHSAFAADLAQVAAGRAEAEDRDAEAFFRRTYVTDGLARLLRSALARLGGRGGPPVVRLQTPFGGGKTHALVALYHLAAGSRPAGGLDLGPWPRARTAVLVGTDLSPARPWPCPALGGRPVRTLWGELAAQLGGEAGYTELRDCDERGVPPGAAELERLLARSGPALLLIDEPLAFVRALYDRRGLPAGSFDANLTFLQALTEAVRRTPAALLVVSLPTEEGELGGEGGREAMRRLQAVLARVDAPWRPAAPEEGPAVVRHRLFAPLRDAAAREAACRACAGLYAREGGAFPPQARDPAYLDRLRSAYPLHPEVFDLLCPDGPGARSVGGTRGLLRLLASAVHALWRDGDRAPLILPGSLPLGDPGVREELARHLGEAWRSILQAEVDGEGSLPGAVDAADPRLGQLGAARRVARTLFLGSALAPDGRCGLEGPRLWLGVVQPGEGVAPFRDALARLRERLGYLHGEGGRVWYAPRPNLNRVLAERAAALEPWETEEEILRRLRLRARERGDFVAVQVWRPGEEVPDEPRARLVVLPPAATHTAGGEGPSAALGLAAEILARRGRRPRQYRNMLLFLAADASGVQALEAAARQYLAAKSLAAGPAPEAADLAAARDAVLDRCLDEAYRWLLVPTQAGAGPVRWEPVRLAGSGPCTVRAAARAAEDELLLPRWSPDLLRRELERWFWTEAPHVELGRLWHDLASYCYLPRLRDEQVLLAAAAEGVARGTVGYADGIAADGRYLGLRLGEPLPPGRPPDGALLVRAEVAQRHLGATGSARAASPPPCPTLPRGFVGSVTLDPRRPGPDAARVAGEVVRHLAALPGARIGLALQVSASVPGGIPAEVAAVVRENCRALGFGRAEFVAEADPGATGPGP